MRITYKVRLIAILSVILVVSFVVVSVFNYHSAREAIVQELVVSSLPLTRENIYSEIIRELMPPISNANLMAHDSFLIDWARRGEPNAEAVVEYLREIRREYGYFTSFFVSARTNNYYYHDGILKQVSADDSHDIWFYDFISSGRDYVLDVDANQAADDRLTIFVNFRVEDFDGTLLGVTGVGMEMEGFSRLLQEKQEAYSRNIYLTDRTGVIQAHPDVSLIERFTVFSMEGIADIALELLLEQQEPTDGSFVRDGNTILVTSRYLPELDWFLIVEQNETQALVSVRNNLFRTILTGIITSVIIIVISVFTVNLYQSKLEVLSRTDELTGTANRREFNNRFQRQIQRFSRYDERFSVVLIDLDNFKNVNDIQGHLAGDTALKETARIIERSIRPTDLLARWGGDEFIVLAECDRQAAGISAERIRQEVQGIDFEITVSCGVAEYRNGDTLDSLTSRADAALYAGKRGGRNQVVFEE